MSQTPAGREAMQKTPAKADAPDRWRKLRRWLLQRGVYWLLVAPYLLPIFGFKNGRSHSYFCSPPLLAPFFFVYPINWALRREPNAVVKNRQRLQANTLDKRRFALDSLTAELGWRTIRGRPRGTTLVGAWQSVINPATFLECIDEQDQSWYVIRNVTNRPTPRWLVGPACAAARELGSPSTQFAFRLFERIGSLIRMSKDELDMQPKSSMALRPILRWSDGAVPILLR